MQRLAYVQLNMSNFDLIDLTIPPNVLARAGKVIK